MLSVDGPLLAAYSLSRETSDSVIPALTPYIKDDYIPQL
jgi:hypothetical protein